MGSLMKPNIFCCSISFCFSHCLCWLSCSLFSGNCLCPGLFFSCLRCFCWAFIFILFLILPWYPISIRTLRGRNQRADAAKPAAYGGKEAFLFSSESELLGLFLLSLLSFGLGLLWLLPYTKNHQSAFLYGNNFRSGPFRFCFGRQGYSVMETASLILGILSPIFLILSLSSVFLGLSAGVISLYSLYLLYLPLPCGALAILFALLSPGQVFHRGQRKNRTLQRPVGAHPDRRHLHRLLCIYLYKSRASLYGELLSGTVPGDL